MSAASESGLWAHTPPKGSTKWHSLDEHSRAVAELAASFAAEFGCEDIARAVGLAHDAGKADPRFQKYLRDSWEGRPAAKCPHAHAGAIAAASTVTAFLLAVAGHHTGIPDQSRRSSIQQNADPQTVRAARDYIRSLGGLPTIPTELITRLKPDPFLTELTLRMVFSCLVDADWLDTEAFGDPSRSGLRGNPTSVTWLKARLDDKLAKFVGLQGNVNEVRAQILSACRAAASQPPGVFSLTVPTGGGKTFAGLAFALDHAVQYGKRRVIVAIPYTSITDQTAMEYRKVFDEENVLEHHSAIEFEEGEEPTPDEIKRRLATENWDHPLIVTTTVQLFESLLSNQPGRCRKLHNLANSVLILDETQALPEQHLGPILNLLDVMVRNFGVTVVLSTATPPDYSGVDSSLTEQIREIVPKYEDHYERLRRVHFAFPSEDWSHDRVAEELRQHRQALVIVNARKDAVKIARAVGDLDGLFHLSTLMCGHHRQRVLREVRKRLDEKLPVRLVSTQVVEAGVDLDFPRVFRAAGPLDRIVQAAGRCNREGTQPEPGLCTVFRLAGGGGPRGAYQTGTALTPPILSEFGQDITLPLATKRYTRMLYDRVATGTDAQRGGVQSARSLLEFETVANTFRMIDQDTVPVVIETYPEVDVAALIAEWETRPKGWHRRISPFVVNLYSKDAENRPDIRVHPSGARIYSGPYDLLLGLSRENPDPSDLVA